MNSTRDPGTPHIATDAASEPRPWRTAPVLLVAGLLWQSLFWIGHVPLVVKIVYAVFTFVACWRPAVALLILAAIAPIAEPLIRTVSPPPVRSAEALVLAFLVGWLVQGFVRRIPIFDRNDSLSKPLQFFTLIVAASLFVVSAGFQPASGSLWQYVETVTRLLARGYLEAGRFETRNWYDAALLVEGTLLVAAVCQLGTRRLEYQRALARMLATGVVAASVLSLVRATTWLVMAADPWALTLRLMTALRVSVHVADFNAAGSHFVLVLPLLWALWAMARRGRFVWGIGVAATGLALWLTGSRAAQLSAMLMLAAVVACVKGRGARLRPAIVGMLLLVAIGGIIAARPAPESSVAATLQIRWMFTQTSVAMLQTSPVFGVGIGGYYRRSGDFMPPALKSQYPVENAHNNFAQIGAELGLVGLAAFVWILAVAWRRTRAGWSPSADPILRGCLLGVAVAMLTFLTGHPLLVPAFACSFWLVFALAIARADTLATETSAAHAPVPVPSRVGPGGWLVRQPRAIAILALLILASVPVRAYVARENADLSHVRFGFGASGFDAATGERFRLVGPSATLFAPTSARSLLLSVSQPTPDEELEFELRIDGRLANQLVLRDGFWRDMRVILPESGSTRAFRRIDVSVRRPSDDNAATTPVLEADGPQVRVRTIVVK
jgi:O-antigen ligase